MKEQHGLSLIRHFSYLFIIPFFHSLLPLLACLINHRLGRYDGWSDSSRQDCCRSYRSGQSSASCLSYPPLIHSYPALIHPLSPTSYPPYLHYVLLLFHYNHLPTLQIKANQTTIEQSIRDHIEAESLARKQEDELERGKALLGEARETIDQLKRSLAEVTIYEQIQTLLLVLSPPPLSYDPFLFTQLQPINNPH